MQRRQLGRIDHHSSVVTLGAAGLGREDLPQAEVDQAVELALAAGVNHLDIAPTYGNAMEHMAPWMPRLREEAWFIGAKTGQRSRQDAWDNIRSCQQRLGIETFDLFQLHAVVDLDDLDQVTQPGGALEALIEMREQGLTRYIGITGHGPLTPSVQLEALNRFDFDTVMFPLTAALYLNADYRRDAQALLAAARRTQRRRPGHQDARPRRLGRRPARTQLLVRPASRTAPDRPGPLVGLLATRPHRPLHRRDQPAPPHLLRRQPLPPPQPRRTSRRHRRPTPPSPRTPTRNSRRRLKCESGLDGGV